MKIAPRKRLCLPCQSSLSFALIVDESKIEHGQRGDGHCIAHRRLQAHRCTFPTAIGLPFTVSSVSSEQRHQAGDEQAKPNEKPNWETKKHDRETEKANRYRKHASHDIRKPSRFCRISEHPISLPMPFGHLVLSTMRRPFCRLGRLTWQTGADAHYQMLPYRPYRLGWAIILFWGPTDSRPGSLVIRIVSAND